MGMLDFRLTKELLYVQFSSDKQKTGGQWKCYKDQLKANIKKCTMDLKFKLEIR